jgi:hypothetical protein
MMDKMDRKRVKRLREELKTILEEPLEKLGFRFELGNASYDEDSVKFTGFRISLANALTVEEKSLNQEIALRDECSWSKSLDKDRIVKINGTRYSLHGFRPKAKKQPFILNNLDKKMQVLCTEDVVDRFFAVSDSKEKEEIL